MISQASRWFAIIVGALILMGLLGVYYVIPETEQVIITQFGKPVGEPKKAAGLHLKVPFIQEVHRIEKRVLEWDGPSAEMPTKDKLYIVVDTFGRWQISDPLKYLLRLRDERAARSRLDDILGSEMRNTIARHDLVEVVRTTKGRTPSKDAVIGEGAVRNMLPAIQLGRVTLEKEVFDAAKPKLEEFGIELLDVQFKRIDYNPTVATKIFERMTSERMQIAERFRSEGAGEAAKIMGNKERELRRIESEAYREVQGIHGRADAEATAIYAAAYNKTQESREFYEFIRTLETYKAGFDKDTTAVLTTQSGLLRFLKGVDANRPNAAPTPVLPPAPTPVPQ